jgi:DNA-binding MarR family transcriptional regulator
MRADTSLPPDRSMPADTEPGMQVVHLLRAVTLELNLLGADFAAANGLHVTDLRAIIELLDAERAGVTATPTWLGQRLQLNSASVTALADRLERMGHVQREHDAVDRRRVLITVTPSAKRLGLAFFGPLFDRIIGQLSGFDAAGVETIHRFLSGLNGEITAHRQAMADQVRPGPPTEDQAPCGSGSPDVPGGPGVLSAASTAVRDSGRSA